MPTPIETRVLDLLSSVEVPGGAGKAVQSWGTEAVTTLCEAALGTYSALDFKLRTNAVAMLGELDHPQALETIVLLLSDPDDDVGVRAMRSAGRQQNATAVPVLSSLLKNPTLSELRAAEAVKALLAMDSDAARSALSTYAETSVEEIPHRRSALVMGYLRRGGH